VSNKLRMAGLTLICILALAVSTVAHHGGAAWDMKTTLTLQGTVTEFRYVNPHVQIYFDATDDKGATVHWSCESADPAMLQRQGWNHEIVKPGDHVTIVGHPAKTGVKVMVLDKLILADGQELSGKAVVN
jgi:hypothetical protein